MPHALLVYPEYPPSYWGMNFALEISGLRQPFRLWAYSPSPRRSRRATTSASWI